MTLLDKQGLILWEFSNEPVVKSYIAIKSDVIKQLAQQGDFVYVLTSNERCSTLMILEHNNS